MEITAQQAREAIDSIKALSQYNKLPKCDESAIISTGASMIFQWESGINSITITTEDYEVLTKHGYL